METKVFHVVVRVEMTGPALHNRVQRDAEIVIQDRIINGRTPQDYEDAMIISGLVRNVSVYVVPEK